MLIESEWTFDIGLLIGVIAPVVRNGCSFPAVCNDSPVSWGVEVGGM